jgi:5'-nucleotidase / UDP-sugar diphosphatase
MNKYIIVILVAAFTFSCKAQAQNAKKPNSATEIIILHTNDIHGNIDNFPRLAFMVDSIRKVNTNVFLLNAGDIFTGNPYVDFYKDKGFPIIDLMNDVGFDLSAIGNHEFDYGQEILNLRMKQAKFPFLCANLINKSGVLEKINGQFQLKTKDGLIINIFSLLAIADNGLPETNPSNLKGLTFENGIEIAKNYKGLKNNANIFLALNHLGIENDEVLAQQMPDLDVIVSGHSHTIIDSTKLVNGVLITQTGSRLKFLGQITLTMENGKIVGKKSKLLPIVTKGNIDPKVKEKVDNYKTNPYFEEIVGQASEKLNNIEEIGSFEADAFRAYADFDISFQNAGGIRVSELEKGNITRGQIYQLDPFGNHLTKIEMNLNEIKSLIINSFKNNQIDLRVSGINYNLITENGKVKDIIISNYKGNPLLGEKMYIVSMNDYILNTYKFDHSNKGVILGVTTSDVIMNYLKNGPINYSGVKRTFVNGK